MWSISIARTQFADDRLASLSVESPTNLHTKEGLGLLVGLWCGKLRGEIRTDQSPLQFTIGFLAGDVVVEPKGGQISNRGRLQTTVGLIKVKHSEIDHSKKEGMVGGRIGFGLSKLIGNLGKAEVDVGGKLERSNSQSEQKDHEYVQRVWRVADAGHNFWRVYGEGLNDDGVLEHKIIGDEPLCHILPDLGSDTIEVSVTFRCSMTDLWFHRTNTIPINTDQRFSQKQAEQNRAAVVGIIAAIALSRTAKSNDFGYTEGDLILAKQTLVAELHDTQKGKHD
ncbi:MULTISPECIES: hypothetical protein [unclassified Bradyrhizobium]|uniref:hypothetical protein n=1 Tax=unclassified Bradyrhizobium TaxID=2631580 RepID=UPI0028E57D07|nr:MULTISPECIES: hypothetical protein [unclassified Bradyrhizobium]